MPSLHDRLRRALEASGDSRHRLVLLVGPAATGKSTALAALADGLATRVVNVSLDVSERLLDVERRRRPLRTRKVLDGALAMLGGPVVVIDHIEILFWPELSQDPLRLLQGVSRNRVTVASWPGSWDGEVLTYAEPGHPEWKRYRKPDAVIVSATEDG